MAEDTMNDRKGKSDTYIFYVYEKEIKSFSTQRSRLLNCLIV